MRETLEFLFNVCVSLKELREDNSALNENKRKLEDQMTTANKRVESIMDDMVQAQIHLEEANNVGISPMITSMK